MKFKVAVFWVVLIGIFSAGLFFPTRSLAQGQGQDCEGGRCDPGLTCNADLNICGPASDGNSPLNTIGTIEKPPGVAQFDAKAQTETGSSIGLIYFVSNIIKLVTIVMGLWALINFIMAGYKLITGQGDPGALGKAQSQITLSVLGLVIMIATYTIIGIIGLLFFGNAGYFLSPTIAGP